MTAPVEADLERAALLAGWLSEKLSVGPVEVVDYSRSAGGYSNDTFILTMKNPGDEGTQQRFVFRWEAGVPIFHDYDVLAQARTMQGLAGTGVPVPEVLGIEKDPSLIGKPFYVMRHIEGRFPPDTPPGPHGHGLFVESSPAERRRMYDQVLDAMAELHELDWRTLALPDLGAPASGWAALDAQIAHWEHMLARAADEPIPLLDQAFEWVKENRYEPSRLSVCWGDAHHGNVLYHDGELRAVLDWEMAHIGPPEADLAWMLAVDRIHLDSHGHARLPGLPDDDEVYDYYARVSGHPIEHRQFHDVFGALRCAITVVEAARKFKLLGIEGWPEDMGSNNPATRLLADVLSRD
jgi:aminoglycoside phosphotransferase (APT) family kinase protein